MAIDNNNRHEFPALRRRLILLQQELYQTSQTLDVNRRVPDVSGDLIRYQLNSDALSREIDELTWVLQYLDMHLQLPRQWPLHYWFFFAILAGVSVGLTGILLLRIL
jgi:hypothetical protein